jgi:LCP family protein required for cell wall assembly
MSKKLLRKIFILEMVIAVIALVFIAVAIWNRPLGPVLSLSTSAPTLGIASSKSMAASLDKPTATPELTPTSPSLLSQIVTLLKPANATSATLCGGPKVMTVLLIGSDERSEDYLYGLADSIRIVRVDFTIPTITTLDIPRDLWVEIPGISDHYGVTHGKLNQAYFFGNPGMGYYDGQGEGPGLLAQTLEQNFGVAVDHYLAVDMKTFVRMVDTLDGIDVYLDSAIDLNQNHDGENPAYVLVAGAHHLDGQMALRLAMNRYPTIFQRADNQNIVLKAIEAKLLSPAMLPRLPELIAQFTRSVQTDLSPSDINKLVCLSQEVSKDAIKMQAFPSEMFTGSHVYDPYRQVNTYIMEADFNLMRTDFADFIAGNWP